MNNLKDLLWYKDENGVLRIKTKLVLSEFPESFTKPALLPSDHTVTTRLVEHYHGSLNHAGTETTYTQIRSKFWVIKGRRTVNKVIFNCFQCKRFRAKLLTVAPAPLPVDRITVTSCFSVVGVDTTGPLYLEDGSKVWVILFTCATFRAVHFELVVSLSTESFLMAFRRFVARRGVVSVCYSDNGTNFVGYRNLLKSLDWSKIQNETLGEGIKWKFIPPNAPWWGGWWERIFRILKDMLRRSLGKTALNFEEMSTIMCDIEAHINMRPLTYVSEQSELRPLTPAHFLGDIKHLVAPDVETVLDEVSFSKRLRYVAKLRNELKIRFQKEYLSGLARYHNLKSVNAPKLKEGDVVLISSDNRKRLWWPLARVIKLFAGKDGEHRVALLQTAKGKLTRPLQRLCSLEVGNASKDLRRETDENLQSEPNENQLKEPTPTSEQLCLPRVTKKGRVIKVPKRYV